MDWSEEHLKQKGFRGRKLQKEVHRPLKSYERETIFSGTRLIVKNGIPLLTFACFAEQESWMGMAFSTRLGGISTGHLAQMNLGWERGDNKETVVKNYQLLCEGLGVNYEKLVFSDQIHETRIEYATESYCAGQEMTKKFTGVDGLFTDKEGLVLATSYADCVPLFFADPKQKIVASSHSGWKGTVGQIGPKTVRAMGERFGCKPEHLICLIGPSICQDCYEVSEDVAVQFQALYTKIELSEILSSGKIPGKFQLDLWAACYHSLKKAGVLPEHIQVSRVCTCCHSDLLFSHRATDGRRGNLNGVIWKRASQEAPESDS